MKQIGSKKPKWKCLECPHADVSYHYLLKPIYASSPFTRPQKQLYVYCHNHHHNIRTLLPKCKYDPKTSTLKSVLKNAKKTNNNIE